MSWINSITCDKGLLAGREFIWGDMTGELTFANYADDVNIIPTTSTFDEKHSDAFVGTLIADVKNWLLGISPTGNVTKQLLFAFKVAHDTNYPLGGTYICGNFWSRDFHEDLNGCSVFMGLEITKRVYVNDVAFTESYPFGNYWPDYERVLWSTNGAPWITGNAITFFFKYAVYESIKNYTLGWAHIHDNGKPECYGSGMAVRIKESYWHSASGIGTDAEDPSGEVKSPEFGPAGKPMGGYIPGGGTIPGKNVTKKPTFDNTSDKIEISAKPVNSAVTTGFFHAYVVTQESMRYIGDALFPDHTFNPIDVVTAIGELAQIIFFSKQIDYVLDALILPVAVPSNEWEHILVGGRYLQTIIEGVEYYINGKPVQNAYVDYSCGSLSIDEYWVNFLDFAGTKVKLFLPYVGYVDIQPEYVIGGTLYVDYRFNVIDGSFMCYVRSDSGYSELEETLVAQYAGVAAQHIPLQSQDYSNKVSGLISAVGSVAVGAAAGSVAAAGVGAVASAANTLVQKPGTTHANGYNASSSFLSHRTPYVIIERQWSQFSEKYPEEIGLPTNSEQRIGDLYGLVKSENAHLDTIPCSAEGKNRIAALLKDGIIV